MSRRNHFFSPFICLFSLIVVFSCSESREKKIAAGSYVIFPSETDVSFRYPHQILFTPTQREAERALQILRQFYEKHNGELLRFESYKIQFIGYRNDKDQKIIWANLFCDDFSQHGLDWTKELILVKDGGNCYFNLEVNLASGEISDFVINGEA